MTIADAKRYFQQGKLKLAIAEFENLLKQTPNDLTCLHALAECYQQNGELAKALSTIDAALAQGQLTSIYMKGIILYRANLFNDAITQFEIVLNSAPNNVASLFSLGACYGKLQNFTLAIEYYKKVLVIKPDYMECLHNLAASYFESADFSHAIEYYNKVIELNAIDAPAHFNLGMLQLLQGDFITGWENYHWRFKVIPHLDPQRYPETKALQPGESVANKTIIIAHEQGFGDCIQMIRYAKYLKEQGAKVIVEAFAPLQPVFKTMPWIDEIFAAGAITPLYDKFITMLDLPRYFHTDLKNIPDEIPYIKADQDKVRAYANLFNKTTQKRIGFVWAGRPAHVDNRKRSMGFNTIKTLIESVPAQFYNLQIDESKQELASYSGKNHIIDLSPYINDFSDTVALVEHLDLIIGIDTAAIHLAAAMNKPTWVIISHVPDWRWMLNRNDSPWYPSLKIYRQPKLHDWDAAIQQVIADLKE